MLITTLDLYSSQNPNLLILKQEEYSHQNPKKNIGYYLDETTYNFHIVNIFSILVSTSTCMELENQGLVLDEIIEIYGFFFLTFVFSKDLQGCNPSFKRGSVNWVL